MTLGFRPAPTLEGEALSAVRHRGSHLQIIASAGSGKTEVVAQRAAELLAEGVEPTGIVAFTFTERASVELKQRIAARVQQRLGPDAGNRMSALFVGTVHSYCFQLLTRRVPRFSTYDVLDDHRLTAFLSREAQRLQIRELDPRHRLFASIQTFLRSVDVVENELLDPCAMPEPFRQTLLAYYEALERYHLLTYGQQVVRSVAELSLPEMSAQIHTSLQHLIVDEYQDINPAQERLITLLTGPGTELCVVGDDDQAIYAWRGSDVENIVHFADRYSSVATFRIAVNRRSRPQIVRVANRFAKSIPKRLPKQMESFRPTSGALPEVVVWKAASELEEASRISSLILRLSERGVPFSDIAVLVRGRSAYQRLLDKFAAFGVPVQPGGRTGLFHQPEAVALGQAFCWLTDSDWRTGFSQGRKIRKAELLEEFKRVFSLSPIAIRRVELLLDKWRAAVTKEERVADLVGDFYAMLGELEIADWDLADPMRVNRLGTLARFSSLLADYESVRRRARVDPTARGEQVGGQDRGSWYYRNLALHIVNYASGAYEGFDGEPGFALDAVDLTTVHRAKGLEWPAVFLPSLTAQRFPPRASGTSQEWLVPREMFPAARYEGGEPDERRLFYVGATRSRDWLSMSRHERVNTNAVQPSPYWLEHADLAVDPSDIEVPLVAASAGDPDEDLAITFSDLAQLLECSLAYRLRSLVGFQPRLAPELGYGRAVHHVLQVVADLTRTTGQVPNQSELDDILDSSFFLPTANKAAHRQLKEAAARLVRRYVGDHRDDLFRIWQTEWPFELRLAGIVVTGRADVILDHHNGIPTALAIVDYKTASDTALRPHQLQLQIYADAGLHAGLDVRAAYVHDLGAGHREPVDVGPLALAAAEERVLAAAGQIRGRAYKPNPGPRCRSCEVRTICPAAEP